MESRVLIMAKAKTSKKIRGKRFGRDPLDWQELHSPTVEIAVDDPESTKKARRNLTRCRQSEAWRHNRLTGMQRDAEKEMEFAWRKRTPGLGASSSRYGEARGGGGGLDLSASVEQSWLTWNRLAHLRRILVPAVIDCLAEPRTLGEIEKIHRMRRGQAFTNYASALDLWCLVRGWIKAMPFVASRPTLQAESVT